MRNKPTLGPWVIESDGISVTRDGLRSRIAMTNAWWLCDEHGGSATENAKLIAAAPELLACLELVYANASESPEWIRSRIDAVLSSNF